MKIQIKQLIEINGSFIINSEKTKSRLKKKKNNFEYNTLPKFNILLKYYLSIVCKDIKEFVIIIIILFVYVDCKNKVNAYMIIVVVYVYCL